jgi:hypothetical protein
MPGAITGRRTHRTDIEMKVLAFVVFLLLPAIGLLFSLRIWLFLRNGLRVTARIVGYKEERWEGGIDTDNQLPADRLVPGRSRQSASGDPAARAAHQVEGSPG